MSLESRWKGYIPPGGIDNELPKSPQFPTVSARLEYYIASAKLVTFTRSGCKNCIRTKRLLEQKRWHRAHLNHRADVLLDQSDDGAVLYEELVRRTGCTTVPYVFIKGKYVGGHEDVLELEKQGVLNDMTK